ncbi:MAG: SDR family NAD(P)-dependent oxidoreductase [Pikeienuella sp.]
MGERLAGKTAIVTGAGSDLGRAIAGRFAEAGARLMLADTSEEALDSLTRELGGKVAHFSCNLEEKLAVNNLLAATKDRFGRTDILVNAARSSAPGAFAELTAQDFDEAFAQNVRTVFVLAQSVAKKMIAQGEEDPDFSGAIVNITSIAAQRTVPELFAYSVACAALDQLTRSMASALAAHRIRVNGVALGSVMTANLRAALRERSELREEMVGVTPLGRIGEVEEAAAAVVYLASDDASFITGQILAVDGGRTILDPLASPIR